MVSGHDCHRGCDRHLQGFLQVPVAGTYVFTLSSTDGSRLTLDTSPGDSLVLINNDGPLSPSIRTLASKPEPPQMCTARVTRAVGAASGFADTASC